jgi:hypothetical protein
MVDQSIIQGKETVMTNPKRRTIPALVAGALGMGGALAMAAEPTQQELLAQLQELQAKVAAMEAKQVNTQDVDATVASVLADADRRSQLMQVEGFTAGYNKGKFVIQSADGNFTLNPYVQFQLRYVANFTDEPVDGADDETEDGFEIRRAKFGFQGNMFTPDLTYKFQWASDDEGGGVTLEDAFVRYQFSDAWAVRAGQYKDNIYHEETTSSTKQLAVDRSLVNELIGGGLTDRVQGVNLIWDDGGKMRAEFGYNDGADSENTDFQDEGATDFGITGRFEWMIAGEDWKYYEDFTAMGNDSDILVLGAGGNWTQSGDDNAYFHTVDIQWENAGGLGVYAAYLGLAADGDAGDSYNWGFLVQAGYMLNEQWEIFGRVDYTDPDDDGDLGIGTDDTTELAIGVNYYLKGHAAKITVDGFYLPDGSPENETGLGILEGENDEFGIRGQFQLLI